MNPAQVMTVAQMNDVTNAINALIVVIIVGISGGVAAWLYQWKISIPRQFKQRDEQRQLELENMRKALENKRAAEAVDIERDRLLPTLVENMMQSNRATIQMAESFHVSITQSIRQTADYSAALKAHDGQLTSNTERLEELAELVDTAVTNIQTLKQAVDKNTDHSKTAAVFGEKAAKVAEDTLEFVRNKIIQVVADTKHDTGELPTLDDLKPATPESKAASDYVGNDELPKAC